MITAQKAWNVISVGALMLTLGSIEQSVTLLAQESTESLKSSTSIEGEKFAQQFLPELVRTYCDCRHQHPVLWVDANTLRFYPIHCCKNGAFCKPAWHQWVHRNERGVVQKVEWISVPQPWSTLQPKRESKPALPAFQEPLTPKKEPAFILPPAPLREPAPAPKPDLGPERKSEKSETTPIPQKQKGVGRSEKIAARR